ncbi:unnamed protein product [Bemisia tabaci]|uniref:Protein stoned-B n=1 Tax=Bemisia tabaci TaxID=7038 RepID=A0A9P0F0C5_BEMTA|nr:unnamed protein product [Bemisia tabaci]
MASAFNPFLAPADEAMAPTTTSGFNPFLSDVDFTSAASTTGENPFLSSYTPSNASTNPFAFTDDTSSSDAAAANFFTTVNEEHPPGDANFFSQEVTSNNIFSDVQVPDTQAPVTTVVESVTDVDFFGGQDDLLSSQDSHLVDLQTSNDLSPPFGTPKRPPPPRPPPSKETKDLILNVTGAMEATSSDLLDRLQANRTPSPTPLRDLHSPSPTPDAQVQNLLGDDINQPNFFDTSQPGFTEAKSQNLLDDTDLMSQPTDLFSQPQPVPVSMHSDLLGSEPPVPEVTPAQPSNIIEQSAQLGSAPPKPKPPKPPPPSRPVELPKVETTLATGDVDKLSVTSGEVLRSADSSADVSITNELPTDSSLRKASIGSSQPTSRKTSRDFASNDIFNSQVHSRKSSRASVDSYKAPSAAGSRKPSQSSGKDIPTPGDPPAFASPHSEVAHTQPSPGTHSELENDVFAPAEPTIQSDQGFPPQQVDAFGASQPTDAFSAVQPADAFGSVQPTDAFGSVQPTDAFSSVPPAEAFTSATSRDAFSSVPSYAAPPSTNVFAAPATTVTPARSPFDAAQEDEFDAFAAKFDSAVTKAPAADPFAATSAFGDDSAAPADGESGFGTGDTFDAFLALQEPPPVPQSTPARVQKGDSQDSDEAGDGFNVFIKPKGAQDAQFDAGILPSLAPPPKSPQGSSAFQDTAPRFNPFDAPPTTPGELIFAPPSEGVKVERTDSQETPPTPLFDEDVSQPLEPFPRIHYTGLGWEMQLRQPNKKKITGQRFWKKIWVRLVFQGETPALQLLNKQEDKDPFQELPLQPCYSVSEIGAQQYDNFGKIFTVKLQFVFYKERPGIRPGQHTKAERLTNKLSQFAAYAIQGDYQGCKEFGSDLKKLGLPVEHAPQISQLFKLGSHNYEDMKQFSVCIEEALFKLPAHRDRALNYKMEEVQITAVDEIYVEQTEFGIVEKQIARVRLFFLGFLSGMPDVELGVNDMVRQGKEVVGRHDIIPVVTEEWIRLEAVEFHNCVQLDNYETNKTIRFKPPDACYIELMRFRVRPPRNRELPLQLKTTMCITGNKVDLRADILVPGFTSRKLGQIPCEDVMVRFPIPECWIYLFRVEKHFRYGSVKSAHRRTGKVKGIERFLGAVDNLEPQLMEVTSGQAKYEHQHRSIVWRMPRLPKEGQGAYTTHNFVCKMNLTSYDQIPEELSKYCYVEFTMPTTQVSHTTVRSVSIHDSDSDNPPEKYVRHLARHEYRVGIEFTQAEGPNEYIAATRKSQPATIQEQPAAPPPAPDSDSDSSG